MIRKPARPVGAAPGSPGRAERLDSIVAMARRETDNRSAGYREQSLRLHPWVCGRCGRSFNRENLSELTVHHRDHNHDNNPSDGSNWENLCIYCHDNEHARYIDHLAADGTEAGDEAAGPATHNPFADLKKLLQKR